MARAKKRARCRGCGKEYEPKKATQQFCSRGCAGASHKQSGEDSPNIKLGQFTPAEKRARSARRKAWRALAARAKAGEASAHEVLRGEYEFAVDRYAELDTLVDGVPTHGADRALSSAATERRLAARHLLEAEAALGNAEQGDAKRPVHIRFTRAAPDAKPGADAGDAD